MLEFSTKITEQIKSSIAIKTELLELVPEIEFAGNMAAGVLQSGKIMLCGNGGSAADAQHIAAELVIRYKSSNHRKALPAMTLAGDPSTITACGNDYGYEKLFSRQVEAWGQPGDLFIGISTSGNSENIIQALKKAKEIGCKTFTLLGGDGGKLKGAADHEIIIPSKITARIQECHILIGHIICSIIEKKLFDLD